MTTLFHFTSLFLFLFHFSLIATPSSLNQQPLSFAALIDAALETNPESRTAWWNARRASSAQGIASSAYYPNVLFNSTVAHGRDYKFPNGHETTYTSAGVDLIVSFLLFDFGERSYDNEAARAALKSANWLWDWALQKVINQVMHNAYSFLQSAELLSSKTASLEDALTSLQAAKELHAAGLRSTDDVYAQSAIVSEMQMAIALQKAESEMARGKLALTVGLPIDSPLELAPLAEPLRDERFLEAISALIEMARKQRADVLAKYADIDQRTAIFKKTRQAAWPKISFNGDAGYRHYIHDHTDGCRYNVGISVDFPVFNGFETTYRNRMAYADLKRSEAELEQLDIDISFEILRCSSTLQAAQEILHLAHSNLENSTKSFEGVLEKYKIGTQSIFDLTAAQRQLAAARIRQSEAKMSWYRSMVELAYATGSLLPYSEVTCSSVK